MRRCDSRNPGDLSALLLKNRIALKANAPFGEQKSSDQHARVAKDLCPGASQPGLFLHAYISPFLQPLLCSRVRRCFALLYKK